MASRRIASPQGDAHSVRREPLSPSEAAAHHWIPPPIHSTNLIEKALFIPAVSCADEQGGGAEDVVRTNRERRMICVRKDAPTVETEETVRVIVIGHGVFLITARSGGRITH